MKIFRLIASAFLFLLLTSAGFAGSFNCYSTDNSRVIETPTDGGIREDIPAKYRIRYDKWKEELLSTDFGRAQWEKYANDKGFILTIAMADKRGQGAGTDQYLWDDDGRFVGATITLGSKLDKGFPDPIYYPVMNSLSDSEDKYAISGVLLAATKIAHELGHVNQTARANRETLAIQNKLMPEYISIFLRNGRNTRDKQLVALADKMGGTPVEIWENREYWSEVNAMSYLKERISKEIFYCDVMGKIQYNIEQYAKPYEDRFESNVGFENGTCRK